MKNQLFEDLIESIKELPSEILEKMEMNMNEEDAPEITDEWISGATLVDGDQMRKDFEAWAVNHYWLREFGPERNLDNLGEYLDPEVQLAWEAFKASRESLVVELPCSFLSDYVNKDEVMDAEQVKESLESQGIKWK